MTTTPKKHTLNLSGGDAKKDFLPQNVCIFRGGSNLANIASDCVPRLFHLREGKPRACSEFFRGNIIIYGRGDNKRKKLFERMNKKPPYFGKYPFWYFHLIMAMEDVNPLFYPLKYLFGTCIGKKL